MFHGQIYRSSFHLKNARRLHKMPNFGVCFDVDGVLARGPEVIPSAAKAIQKLTNQRREWIVPVVFITNSSVLKSSRSNYLSELLGVQVSTSQVVQAPSPLEVYTSLHDKFCLVVGQGNVVKLANENKLGNVCTVDDVSEAYPLLDMVNSERQFKSWDSKECLRKLPQVEAVVLMGESTKWETSLQLVVDLLRTGGLPYNPPSNVCESQLPLFACGFDLEYGSRAPLPRFGHGAFLSCLDVLYKKTSGRDIQYAGLTGKPTEVTFRYADYILNQQAQKLGAMSSLETMYMIGDAPEADILGSNLYKKYIKSIQLHREGGCSGKEAIKLANEMLPECRHVPDHEMFFSRTVKKVEGLLVSTGVYKKGEVFGKGEKNLMGMSFSGALKVPDVIFDDVGGAVEYIFKKENLPKSLK